MIENDKDKDNDNDSDSDNDKDKAKNKVQTVTYRLKFIDSYRFMQDSLSSLVDNLSEVNNKNLEISHDTVMKKFHNTYQLCDNDFDKFNLLLRKGVYPYEYMDKWEKFNEDKLPDKESFYSELNKEHITNEDYAHAQKVWDTFNIKNLGEYHDLYVQSDTALLADVFDNFRDKCIEIYRVDPAHFLTAPGKFGKTMENVRNHRDITIVTSDKRRSILASEPNYHSTKYISKDLIIMEMRKTEVKMNKPIYLGQAILDISKTLMYEFWYDYIKPKYGDKARLCYMDTDSFVMYIKTEDFYKDIAGDVERWFDTSNYAEKDKRPLPIGKNKKVIGKFKDELGGKIMSEFCALKAKAYAFKLDNDTEVKKAKGTKKCIVKREITFKNYVDAFFKDKTLIKSQQQFRSDHHKVYTEEVNKIALSSNDDKRIQTFDKVTTYPCGTNTFMVFENEMKYKS